MQRLLVLLAVPSLAALGGRHDVRAPVEAGLPAQLAAIAADAFCGTGSAPDGADQTECPACLLSHAL